MVKIEYYIDEKQIVLTIYLENAPYYQESVEQANMTKQMLGNRQWYITEYDNYQTIIAFEDGYVYSITADSLDIIKIFMKGN